MSPENKIELHVCLYKQLGIVCLLCWLGLSCTLQRTEHPALRQAGYLMEEHSDSAFSLLKSISSLTGMSPEDKAGYALLLAEAADKMVIHCFLVTHY